MWTINQTLNEMIRISSGTRNPVSMQQIDVIRTDAVDSPPVSPWYSSLSTVSRLFMENIWEHAHLFYGIDQKCLRFHPPRSSPQPMTDGKLVDEYPLLAIILKHSLSMDNRESILSLRVPKQTLTLVALNGNWLDTCLLSASFHAMIYSPLSCMFPEIASQINNAYLNFCFRTSFRRNLKSRQLLSLDMTSESTTILCLY